VLSGRTSVTWRTLIRLDNPVGRYVLNAGECKCHANMRFRSSHPISIQASIPPSSSLSLAQDSMHVQWINAQNGVSCSTGRLGCDDAGGTLSNAGLSLAKVTLVAHIPYPVARQATPSFRLLAHSRIPFTRDTRQALLKLLIRTLSQFSLFSSSFYRCLVTQVVDKLWCIKSPHSWVYDLYEQLLAHIN
jgi:hypothetical protein